MLAACRTDGDGFAIPTFDLVPSDVEGFMEELWGFQSAFHDCFARSEPRAHFFDYMVGQCSQHRQCWEAETPLAQLQSTMKMDVLHGKTVLGVHKDLRVFAILSHRVRLVILPSATQPQVGVERSSCGEALRWRGAPATGVPLEVVCGNPARPKRIEPRVKKRRPKAFPWMTKPRRLLRQALIQQTLGA